MSQDMLNPGFMVENDRFLSAIDDFRQHNAELVELARTPIRVQNDEAQLDQWAQEFLDAVDRRVAIAASAIDHVQTQPQPRWGVNAPTPRPVRPPTTDELGRPYATRDLPGYLRNMYEGIFAPFDPPHINTRQLARTGGALGLAAAVLIGANTQNSEPNTPPRQIVDGLEVAYTEDYAVVTVPALESEGQDPAKSSVDAAVTAGLEQDDVAVQGDKLLLPSDVDEATIVRAVIGASAKDTVDGEGLRAAPSTTIEQQAETAPVSIEAMTDAEFIDWIAENTKPTAEEYRQFDVDTSRQDVFKEELSGDRIEPRAFVGHWTGARYENGVDQFVSAIKNREGNCCSVMYFMDRDAKVYRFSDSWEKMAHAYGANSFTQGVEIEAAGLKDYTPEQMKAFIYLSYRFMKANDIVISRDTFLGHEEVDAEYGNHQKPDMPRELVDKLFPILERFAREVEAANTPAPEEANPKGYHDALMALLTEIRQHEGGWDSINRGGAGDTRLYGDAYFAALGGRKLSELTIQEILDLQAADKIMAVGADQFIPGTFRSAVKSTGIDTNRKFDEATQNELAINYLLLSKRETLSKYLKAESEDIEGALRDLCYEWASVPCADGESHYAGMAGNKSVGGLPRREELRSMLVAARAAKLAELQPKAEVPEVNNNVVFIGDSLTVGYTKFGEIESQDESVGLNILVADGVGGRPLVGSEGSDDGLHAIEANIDSIKQAGTVVVALGTNAPESEEQYQAGVEQLIQRIHQPDVNPLAKIVFVSGFSYEDGSRSAQRRDRRTEILNTVADPNPDVYVIDVKHVLQSGSFAGDNVHLTADGYKKAATEILTQTAQIARKPSENQPVPAPVEAAPQTTTSVPTSLVVEQPVEEIPVAAETKVINNEIMVSRESALEIYRVYFLKDGVIDQSGLEAFVESLPQAQNDKGEQRFSVGTEYIPGEYKP